MRACTRSASTAPMRTAAAGARARAAAHAGVAGALRALRQRHGRVHVPHAQGYAVVCAQTNLWPQSAVCGKHPTLEGLQRSFGSCQPNLLAMGRRARLYLTAQWMTAGCHACMQARGERLASRRRSRDSEADEFLDASETLPEAAHAIEVK